MLKQVILLVKTELFCTISKTKIQLPFSGLILSKIIANLMTLYEHALFKLLQEYKNIMSRPNILKLLRIKINARLCGYTVQNRDVEFSFSQMKITAEII